MDIDKCRKEARIAIGGEEIESVSNFEYLGARIEANGKNTPEIRRRLAMATPLLTKMISIWKGQCKKKKLRVLETVVFPNALYGCESFTINNTDAKRITSFEMICYRKILRISWMEKVTNKEVLSRLVIKTTLLLQKAKTLKLKYFGHIKRHETLERHILEARIDGRRGRGRPTRRWELPRGWISAPFASVKCLHTALCHTHFCHLAHVASPTLSSLPSTSFSNHLTLGH